MNTCRVSIKDMFTFSRVSFWTERAPDFLLACSYSVQSPRSCWRLVVRAVATSHQLALIYYNKVPQATELFKCQLRENGEECLTEAGYYTVQTFMWLWKKHTWRHGFLESNTVCMTSCRFMSCSINSVFISLQGTLWTYITCEPQPFVPCWKWKGNRSDVGPHLSERRTRLSTSINRFFSIRFLNWPWREQLCSWPVCSVCPRYDVTTNFWCMMNEIPVCVFCLQDC